MSRLFLLGTSVLLLVSISGCSIFSFKIKASRSSDIPELSVTKSHVTRKPNVPSNSALTSSLPSQEKVRKFVQSIPAEIEKSADALTSLTLDQQQHSKAMLWKKLASDSIQQILRQSNSEAVLFDTWIYMKQMDEYFSTGVGRYSFGRNQYIALGTSKNLYSKISRIAQNSLTEFEYNQMKSFVSDYFSPFANSLMYKTAYNRWLVRKDDENEEFLFPTTDPYEKQYANLGMQSDNYSGYERGNKGLLNAEQLLLNSWNKFTADLSNIEEDKALPKDMLGKVLLASNLQGNPIISKNLKSLAIEMTGSLTPLAEMKNQEEIVAQDEGQKSDNISESIEEDGVTTDLQSPTNEKTSDTEDVQNLVGGIMDNLWNDLAIFFPSVLIYLFLLIALVFVVPFLLGYFIGKKRQDPNFTIISSDQGRKALN